MNEKLINIDDLKLLTNHIVMEVVKECSTLFSNLIESKLDSLKIAERVKDLIETNDKDSEMLDTIIKIVDVDQPADIKFLAIQQKLRNDGYV